MRRRLGEPGLTPNADSFRVNIAANAPCPILARFLLAQGWETETLSPPVFCTAAKARTLSS